MDHVSMILLQIQTSLNSCLINLCGHAIEKIDHLDYKTWENYKTNDLRIEISNYSTFARIIISLKMDEAVNLLRTRFLGSFGPEKIIDRNELKSVEFLVAEGVLICIGKAKESSTFQMFSPIIDSLIQRCVISELYPTASLIRVP